MARDFHSRNKGFPGAWDISAILGDPPRLTFCSLKASNFPWRICSSVSLILKQSSTRREELSSRCADGHSRCNVEAGEKKESPKQASRLRDPHERDGGQEEGIDPFPNGVTYTMIIANSIGSEGEMPAVQMLLQDKGEMLRPLTPSPQQKICEKMA